MLRFVQGLSLAEVGTVQGVSEDAARMRIQRALARLRTELSSARAKEGACWLREPMHMTRRR